jgi:hypothetical protein
MGGTSTKCQLLYVWLLMPTLTQKRDKKLPILHFQIFFFLFDVYVCVVLSCYVCATLPLSLFISLFVVLAPTIFFLKHYIEKINMKLYLKIVLLHVVFSKKLYSIARIETRIFCSSGGCVDNCVKPPVQ